MPIRKWEFLLFVSVSVRYSVTVSVSDPITQQKLDRVQKLPGQSFNVDFAHYAGYVTVNEESGRALFYWFTETAEDPASRPLALWLNGGPGCSSIAYGMAEEVGPFHVNKGGKSVYLNPYSWNTASDSLQFLLNWLERFPQYKGRDFYITGESYAGHYIPQLSQAIVRYNKENSKSPINLKGYMVGNGLTDAYSDHVGVFQFLWSCGMISDQTYKKSNELCDKESFFHPSRECQQIIDIGHQEMGNIDEYSISTPPCTANGVSKGFLRRFHKGAHIGQTYDPCTYEHSTVYFNLPEVQNALHVFHSNTSRKWEDCNEFINLHWQDSPNSVLDVHKELISSGLRAWIYSGDADAVIPVASTRYSIDALNLTSVGPWRAWYDDGQVGGWTQGYEGLNYVTVRGAGHEVPYLKPKQALVLLKNFLAGTPMPSYEQVIESKSSSSEQVSGF